MASLLGMLLHGYLSGQAWLDWAIAYRLSTQRWRHWSALGYFFGQLFLCIPEVLHLIIGVGAMILPPPVREVNETASDVFQYILVGSQFLSALAAIAFWYARHAAIQGRRKEHDAANRSR